MGDDSVNLDFSNNTDLPVAFSFSDQKKQRQLNIKQINKSIANSLKRNKEARKAKHKQNLSNKKTHNSEGLVESDPEFVPIELNNTKYETKSSIAEELSVSKQFNVFEHLEDPSSDSVSESLSDHPIVSANDAGVNNIESDEGYDGSEEQDRIKLQIANISKRKVVFPKEAKKSRIRQDMDTDVSNLKWHKIERMNGIRVRLLDSFHVERAARNRAEQFNHDRLFSVSNNGRYGDVKRIQVNELKSLARKLKAR